MKTLKKTLCLVLAVVMAVGVLMIPASATDYDDFTDKDEIKHEEAVAVLNGIGIIDGKENDNFDPKGTLTRGEAAKMVVTAKLGSAAENLTASASKFTDVAGHWAAKYISYAAQIDILQGNGDGTVEPEGKLTGYALAKMLLVAAGVKGTYIGADWENNVMLAATQNGFLAGVEDIKLAEDISRDDAAQMVWNAVQYSPNGKTTEFVVKDGERVIYQGNDATEAYVTKMAAGNGATLDYKETSTGSIGDTVFGLTSTTADRDFGRTSTKWTAKGNVEVVLGLNPVLKYDDSVKLNKIASDLGYTTTRKSATVTVYNDGVKETSTRAINRGTTESVGELGSYIEVYKTGADTYNIIVINSYVKVLAKSDVKSATSATETADAVPAYIILDTDLTYDTNAFKPDDVVLYTKTAVYKADGTQDGYAAVDVMKADSVSGAVTAIGANNAYVRIDNVQYVLSKNNTFGSQLIGSNELLSLNNVVNTYYLDNNGHIVHARPGETVDPDAKYVYVLDVAAVGADKTDGDDLFGTNGEDVDALAQAKVIDLTDGKLSVVDIAIVKTAKGWMYATATGAASDKVVEELEAISAAQGGGKKWKGEKFEPGIYTYNDVDGDYAIGNRITFESVTLKKNEAVVGSGANVRYANSSTVLTVVNLNKDNDGASITSSNGIVNFPAAGKTYSNAVVIYNPTTKVISSVIAVENYTDPTADVNYAIYVGPGETTSDGTAHRFFTGTEEVQYVWSNTVTATSLRADTVYNLKITSGKLTGATEVETSNKLETQTLAVVDPDDDYVIVGDKQYNLAENAVIVNKLDTAKYEEGELEVNDIVSMYFDKAATDSSAKVVLVVITGQATEE